MVDLIETFGDISVPEKGGVLTRDRAEALTDGFEGYACQPRHASNRGKRCFDEDAFFALKDRLTTTGLSAPLKRSLVETVKEHLDRNNVLIHVFPPTDDSFLWERGWNGAVPTVDHDYIMVIDSSFPGHSTAGVQPSWDYRVSLNPGQPVESQLRIRYKNSDGPKNEICRQFAWDQYHCYWNYLRVYIPPLARDIEMPDVPLHQGALKLIWGYQDADSATVVPSAPTGTSRLTELGAYIVVEPGSVTTIPLRYRLEPEALRPTAPGVYEYRLFIQKQAGMDEDRVSVGVELPKDAEMLETSPRFTSRRGRWLQFDFLLQSDTFIVVTLRMKSGG